MTLVLPDRKLSRDLDDFLEKLTAALQEQLDPEQFVGKFLSPGMIVWTFDENFDNKSFLICDGAAYNSEDFPELAQAIGSDADTFTIPDLTGVTPDAIPLVKV